MRTVALGACVALFAVAATAASAQPRPKTARPTTSATADGSVRFGVLDLRSATDPERLGDGRSLIYVDQQALGGNGLRLYAHARRGETTRYTATTAGGGRLRLDLFAWTIGDELAAQELRRRMDRLANRAEERRRRWEEAIEQGVVAAQGGKQCLLFVADGASGTFTAVAIKCPKGI